MRELTTLQEQFVHYIVNDAVSASEAARRAGYAPTSARQSASQLMADPKIQAAIRAEQYKFLGGTLASKAIHVLESIMTNEDAPTGARVDAAKTILDRAGVSAISATRESVKPTSGRSISELSVDELVAVIENAETMMAEQKARMIEHS